MHTYIHVPGTWSLSLGRLFFLLWPDPPLPPFLPAPASVSLEVLTMGGERPMQFLDAFRDLVFLLLSVFVGFLVVVFTCWWLWGRFVGKKTRIARSFVGFCIYGIIFVAFL